MNQVYLLHRHLIWSSYERERFRALVPGSKPPDEDPAFLGSEFFATLAIWNSLLWVVISGFNEKEFGLSGRAAAEVAA